MDAELNPELKKEVNGRLEDLLKKIGNNRQQLSNKVVGFYRDINKEMNREKLDTAAKESILKEVAGIERMAAKQLPHLEKVINRPPAPSEPKPARQEAPAAVEKKAPEKKAPEKKAPEKTAKPAAKSPSKPASKTTATKSKKK